MNCSNCNKEKQNGEVIDGQFICTDCRLSGMAKKILQKSNGRTSQLVEALKQCGLKGNIARGIYENEEFTDTRIIKMVWIFRYFKSKGLIKSKHGFMPWLIRNDRDLVLDDGFWDYYKNKMNNPIENDYPVLYKGI